MLKNDVCEYRESGKLPASLSGLEVVDGFSVVEIIDRYNNYNDAGLGVFDTSELPAQQALFISGVCTRMALQELTLDGRVSESTAEDVRAEFEELHKGGHLSHDSMSLGHRLISLTESQWSREARDTATEDGAYWAFAVDQNRVRVNAVNGETRDLVIDQTGNYRFERYLGYVGGTFDVAEQFSAVDDLNEYRHTKSVTTLLHGRAA